MNFRWKDAVWLALDDCGDNPTTQDVYSYVQKYRQLADHQRAIDNQGVMERYKNTVRNILNGFRRDGIIEGAKENPELKYGDYNWIGACAKKESRKEIRKEVENGLPLEYVLRNSKPLL
jgi:hypothetical protein